jgi:hypothetical protein
MRRPRTVLLALAGVGFPIALALGSYFISIGLGVSSAVPGLPNQAIHRQVESGSDDGLGGPGSPTPSGGSDRCTEAEHRTDPQCISVTGSATPSGDDHGGSTPSPDGGSGTSDGGSGTSGGSSSGTSGGPGPSAFPQPTSSGSDSGHGGGDD